MIRWAAGLARRICGAVILLLLLLCGAEVAIRLSDLGASRQNSARWGHSPTATLIVPSWTSYQELRPLATLRMKSPDGLETHVVRVNSYGLRGPEPECPKPADLFRV